MESAAHEAMSQAGQRWRRALVVHQRRVEGALAAVGREQVGRAFAKMERAYLREKVRWAFYRALMEVLEQVRSTGGWT